jgi:hypothetical protein
MVSMIDSTFRPKSITPKYPPYHNGEYLEEYFFRRWNEENIHSERKYIDIFWTNIFCNSMFGGNQYPNIQDEINTLPEDETYFTVCQFDDGPLENFPKDTLIFSAGGNREGDNIIPIPLICSPIPRNLIPSKEKTIFASFVGSRNTHPIRMDMCKYLSNHTDYSVVSDSWSSTVPMDSFRNFVEITCSSKFSLAPRGYGKQSFRLYEILQLGSVPVYISDEHYLPWMDEIDWNSFCVPVNEDEIEEIDDILKSISDEKYNKMLEAGQKIYREYFTLEGMFQNIVRKILND